eukprot:tig00021504_g21975.t1
MSGWYIEQLMVMNEPGYFASYDASNQSSGHLFLRRFPLPTGVSQRLLVDPDYSFDILAGCDPGTFVQFLAPAPESCGIPGGAIVVGYGNHAGNGSLRLYPAALSSANSSLQNTTSNSNYRGFNVSHAPIATAGNRTSVAFGFGPRPQSETGFGLAGTKIVPGNPIYYTNVPGGGR